MDPKKLKAQLAAAFSEPTDAEIERIVQRDIDIAARMYNAIEPRNPGDFAAVLRHVATVRGELRRARAFEAIANALPSFFPEPRPPRDEAGFDIPPGIDPN